MNVQAASKQIGKIRKIPKLEEIGKLREIRKIDNC